MENNGEVPERLNGTLSKSVSLSQGSGVQIPPSPQGSSRHPTGRPVE